MSVLSKRLPFELAEPGTDPTQSAPPRPRRSLIRENQWLVIGLLVFLGVGYWKFVRKPAPRQAVAADPAPTVVASPTPAPGGFFDGDGGNTGFFPTAQPPPTATATLPATVTPLPTPTPVAEGIEYGVFVDGEQVICSCLYTGDVIGPAVCHEYVPTACGGRSDEQ